MKKVILLLLTTIICSTVTTKTNTIDVSKETSQNSKLDYLKVWEELYQYSRIDGHRGLKISCPSPEHFRKNRDAFTEGITIHNAGNDMAMRCQSKTPPTNSLKPNTCQLIMKAYCEAYASNITEQEETGTRIYNDPKEKEAHDNFINDVLNKYKHIINNRT